jgi:hypothetical protein
MQTEVVSLLGDHLMQPTHCKQQLFQSSCVFSLHKILWKLCDWNKVMQIS